MQVSLSAARSQLKALWGQPHYFFAVTAGVFGIILCFLIPPMQTYDEQSHFFRAYQISESHIRPSIFDGGAGGYMPTRISRFGQDFTYAPMKKRSAEERISAINKNLNIYRNTRVSGGMAMEYFPNTGVYPPVVYAPQVTAIVLGRTAHLPILDFYYLGRLFNLACWIFCVYVAIRLAPVAKWAFVILGLAPVSLFQGATFSADALTNGLAFVVVALFLRYVFSTKRILPKDYWWVTGMTVALSLCKPGFWVAVFLFLLIPIQRFESVKHYMRYNGLLIGINVAVLGLWTYAIRNVIPYIAIVFRPGEHVKVGDQINAALQHPLNFPQALLHSYTGDHLMTLYKNSLGTMGWGDVHIGDAGLGLATILVGTAIFIAITEASPVSLRPWQRVGAATILLMMLLLVSVSLYTSYTPVGKLLIDGVQGRYFVTLGIFLLPVVVARLKPLSADRRWFILTLARIGLIAMPFFTLGAIWSYYYG